MTALVCCANSMQAPVPTPCAATLPLIACLLVRPACRYAFNIIFNILNKSTLNAFPCPWFISTLQLGGCCCYMLMHSWGSPNSAVPCSQGQPCSHA